MDLVENLRLRLRGRRARSERLPSSQARHGSPHRDATLGGQPTSTRAIHEVRLTQVYPQPTSGIETDVDIIAVHGLDTNSEETWTWGPKDNGVNWLKDMHMLPQQFPTTRIFTCDWPANLFETSDFVQLEFEELARVMLDGIKNRPAVKNSAGKWEERPVIFIASCLGGVILMKVLVMASQPKYQSVERATRGIVFLATPFRGTSFQDVFRWAEPGLRTWASINGKRISKMIAHVTQNFRLDELRTNFTAFCEKNDLTHHLAIFYETGNSSLPRKIAHWLPKALAQEKPLVNSSSARLDIVQNPRALGRPHVLMNKFHGPQDPDYTAIVKEIDGILCNIRQGRPIERADALIRNERYSQQKLKIERLSGDLLPMEISYINLALVERSNENLRDGKKEATARTISPSSIPTEYKAELMDTIEIMLPTLFNPRRVRARPDRRPCRILIHGQAGAGKTTLCKKIVHDFTYSGMWRGLFDRVLWVPLRNLKREERRRSSGYNLGSLLYDEYFSQHMEGNSLAQALWHALGAKGSTTLFVLDGLDEVAQDLEGTMLLFLKELLDQPNVIITSRPYSQLPRGIKKVDLILETTGFHPDQVNAYIEKTFADPVTGETNAKPLAELQSYLKKHQVVQALVRIPILLDALCFTWEGRDKDVRQTMTAIYKAIEQSLLKKDAFKLERLTEARLDLALPKEFSNCVEEELSILQALAFAGIYRNVIEFETKHREAISRQFNLPNVNFLLDEMLGHMSFMRTSDPSSQGHDRSYHFLHLTFQEFFAAQYFVRHWQANKPLPYFTFDKGRNKISQPASVNPTDFLREHKYNARYDIFWRFVTGLLDFEDEDEETNRLFEVIEGEPLDILGPMHQRLIMHCLSEAKAELTCRDNLEEKLLQWLNFECGYTNRSRLVVELEFPQSVLEKALRSSPNDRRIILLKSLNEWSMANSSVLELAASWLEDYYPVELRRQVLCTLERQNATLGDRSISLVASHLADENWFVRKAALRVLKGFTDGSALTPEILERVAAQLEDSNWCVRQAALETLKALPHRLSLMPKDILAIVTVRLGDIHSSIREAAVSTLKSLTSQPVPPPEIIKGLAIQLKGESSNVRVKAVSTLKALIDQWAPMPEIFEALATGLRSKYSDVRDAALHMLKVSMSQWIHLRGTIQEIKASLQEKESSITAVVLRLLVALADQHAQLAMELDVIQESAARLENQDNQVKIAALQVCAALKDKSALSPEILQRVATRLEDRDVFVRLTALDVLLVIDQSLLTREALQKVATWIADEHKERPLDVLKALLAYKDLSVLIPVILQRVVAQPKLFAGPSVLEALKSITDQSRIKAEIFEELAVQLENEDEFVRGAVLQLLAALTDQSALTDKSILMPETIRRIGTLVEDDEDLEIRIAALETLVLLTDQSVLTPEILQRVAMWLEDEDAYVRIAALELLEASKGQLALAPDVFQRVAIQLRDENTKVVQAALKVFTVYTDISVITPEILEEIARHNALDDMAVDASAEDALEALTDQLMLEPQIFERVSARLEEKSFFIRQPTLRMLLKVTDKCSLTSKTLQRVAALLEDVDLGIRRMAFDVVINHPTLPFEVLEQNLAPLYRVLLRESFDQPFSWFKTEEASCISTAGREIRCPGLQYRFMKVIRQTQIAIAAPLP